MPGSSPQSAGPQQAGTAVAVQRPCMQRDARQPGRKAAHALAAAVLLLGFSHGTFAQNLDLSWSAMSSGAGEMAGGSLLLEATFGYGEVEVLTGGPFRLVAGFWNPISAFPCDGDFNGDRSVGLPDLVILLANYGTASGATYDMGDMNGDGAVSLPDITLLLANFGRTCPR